MLKNTFFFVVGLGFLFLAKTKHILQGYSTPKPFGTADTERCVTYDIGVVDEWLDSLEPYLGVNRREALTGREILELGPGSDLGVGLYLLALGAEKYSACDVNSLAVSAPMALYESLFVRLEGMGYGERTESLSDEIGLTRSGKPSRLNYVVREDFDLMSAFGEQSVDLVFSHAAFEHFDNIDSTVAGLSRVCRPGAVIVAHVDLQTHSRWIRDKDPNNIYRYPQWLYELFAFRGSPNRVRPYEYVAAFERYGWDAVVVSPESRRDARDGNGMNRRFRDIVNEMDLMSIVICTRLGSATKRTREPAIPGTTSA